MPLPWHRRTDEPQTETCQICGSLQNRSRLIEPDTEGMRGFAICDNHGFASAAAFEPSFNDLRSSGPPFTPDLTERLEPIGMEFWFEDDIGGPGEEF